MTTCAVKQIFEAILRRCGCAAVVLLPVPLFWFWKRTRPSGRARLSQPPVPARAVRCDRYPAPAAADATIILMLSPVRSRLVPPSASQQVPGQTTRTPPYFLRLAQSLPAPFHSVVNRV